MTDVVIDCSFSSSIFLPDEQSLPVQKYIEKQIDKIQMIVPVLWWYETANVLTMARKRNRIGQTEIDTVLELLDRLPIRTDYSQNALFTRKILSITHNYMISAYDAVYLEAAIRNRAALATLDKNLSQIADKAGITIVRI